MTGRGDGRYLGGFGGVLLATAPSTILSACLISNVIRYFIFGSIVLTIVVAQREGAPA
jgi:ribose/xylose/arabinose/galactoside ABC-type transport system permease subunit